MARKGRAKLRKLVDAVEQDHPEIADARQAILARTVLVNGLVVDNPETLVRPDASVVGASPRPLRGEAKLRAALASFGISASGCTALDVGAAAGGFTRVLLEAGAKRVYAVDVGFGQLLGSLRQDPRVVNLERTNLADVTPELVPEAIAIVTLDLSYLPLGAAVRHLDSRIELAPNAELVGVVKPQFELGLSAPPKTHDGLLAAKDRAVSAVAAAGWSVVSSIESPIRGSRGSTEFLLHARRRIGRVSAG
jgi:23S rRNA (cytidine1920-2'-O)/16S rRNA (cytidine1409-2'-O)-methyltransferase